MAATYTVKQVAQILGYSTNSIYTFLKEKRIKGVRVGRGRFRIPQSELNRLLGDKSKNIIQSGNQKLQSGQPENLVIQTNSANEFVTQRIDVPSLFDWFSGISAITLGISMFLFSLMFEEFSLFQFAQWLPVIRTALIISGLGILLTDITRQRKSLWHTLFIFISGAGLLTLSLLLGMSNDLDGAFVLGITGLAVVCSAFVPLNGLSLVKVYSSVFLLLVPICGMITGGKVGLVETSTNNYLIWIFITLISVLLVWLKTNSGSKIYWIGPFIQSLMFIILAIVYSREMYWGRAFVLLTAGLSILALPSWTSLEFAHQRDRKLVFMTFGIVGIVMLVALSVVRVMQTNIIDYAKNELLNKSTFGRFLVESSLESARVSLDNSAVNPEMVALFNKPNSASIQNTLRTMFEARGVFKQLVLYATKLNRVIGSYPLSADAGTGDLLQYHFNLVVTSGKTQWTELPGDGKLAPGMFVIASPIVSSKNEVIGVLAGYVDLASLELRLSQLATSKNGDTMSLINNRMTVVAGGKDIVIRPEIPARDNQTGGIVEGYTGSGLRALTAFNKIAAYKWVVTATIPVSSIVRSTHMYAIAIFIVVVVTVLIVGLVFSGVKRKVKIDSDGP
jgi:excisionase family DNA binding protein